jgi:hypothetical protein
MSTLLEKALEKVGALSREEQDAIASQILASLAEEDDRAVLSVASKVASMPDREAAQRYHDLVDKQLDAPLAATEHFELERIEARLDAGDRNPLLEARDREWETDRTRLLDSIHVLLTRFQK